MLQASKKRTAHLFTDPVLKKLNDYYITCKIKHHKHMLSSEFYRKKYKNTTIPLLLISSITTVLASFNGNLMNRILAIIVAVFSGVTTVAQSMSSFLKYNIKFDLHNRSAIKYIKLAGMIETEVHINYFEKLLNLSNLNNSNTPEDLRVLNVELKKYVKYLFEKIQTKLDAIIEMEPYHPTKEITNTKYKDVLCGSSDIDEPLVNFDDILSRQSTVLKNRTGDSHTTELTSTDMENTEGFRTNNLEFADV